MTTEQHCLQVYFLSPSFWRWKWFLLKSAFCAASSSKFSSIWAKFWLPFWRSGNETGESSSSWQPFQHSSFSSTGQSYQNPLGKMKPNNLSNNYKEMSCTVFNMVNFLVGIQSLHTSVLKKWKLTKQFIIYIKLRLFEI